MNELRKEFCKKEGYNFIDFETLEQAEKYILFLENRFKAINYTRCCEELKVKKELTFDEFVRLNFDTEDTQYYNKLGHELWSEEDVVARYKLTKGNCL